MNGDFIYPWPDADPPVGPSEVRLSQLPVAGWRFDEARKIRENRPTPDAVEDFESVEEKATWTRVSRDCR